ncbi:MAG: MBL fold metallo-hydrolase [Elusimicrobia bacterium]|nr:MBL fold metallo-hydrolase [Elusimicrobiota bacterium]
MELATLSLGYLATNCYILYGETSAVVIDPAAEPSRIFTVIDYIRVPVSHIIYTHAHWDHTGAGSEVKEYTGAEIFMSELDRDLFKHIESGEYDFLFSGRSTAGKPDKYLKDGDEVVSGDIRLKIISTPGHSPGGISLYTSDMLFSGDTIFRGSIGRTDLPGGDLGDIRNSIMEKIFKFPENTVIYPGHGPSTTISWEKKNNPYTNSEIFH